MGQALDQLIAQQTGPQFFQSAMAGVQAANQEKQQAQTAQLNDLQIKTGTQQLAAMGQAQQEANRAKGMKIIADANQVLKSLPAEQRPAAYAQIKAEAEREWPGQEPWPAQYNDQVQNHMDMVTQHVYGAEKFKTDEAIRQEQAKNKGPESAVGKLIQDRASAAKRGASAEELASYDNAIKKAGTIGKGQNISLSINDGNQQLSKKTADDVQKQILDAEKGLSDLDTIAGGYSDKYLTYGGRAKAMLGGLADKAGVEMGGNLSDFNAERTKFRNSVNQYFNQYRKEITGAAASEKEMEFLKDSMFNEDLGPKEFKAAFDQFRTKAQKNYELNKRAARQGLNVQQNSKGWQLHTDAQGNKAFVSPDGSQYEEMPEDGQ